MKNSKPKDRKQPITMDEIARLAGVSQSTVSRVLNGNAPVAPEKYTAVMEIIERLNYRPNIAAQGLVSGRTSTIGIVTRVLGSPFYGELLRGIATGLQKTNYHPVIGLGGDLINEDLAAVDLLLARRVDALILLYSLDLPDDYIQELAKTVPLIVIGRQVPGLEKWCVVVNNVSGGYLATSTLISKGHTRIAHVSGQLTVRDAVDRLHGYRQALTDHHLPLDPMLIVEGDFSESSGVLAVDKLLAIRNEHPFSAIFVANDQMAQGVRLALYHRQIKVPSDISLIGYDDMPGSEYMTPPLTTIRQPVYYMGLMAVQAILSILDNEHFSLPEFPVELVMRQSVAIASNSRKH